MIMTHAFISVMIIAVKKKIKNTFLIILGVILILFILIKQELVKSAESLTVNTFVFETDKIDNPVNVVIIGDLHNHEFGYKLPEKIKELNPDLILMAGDMIDQEKKDEYMVCTLIAELKDTAPVIYALGNHEMNYKKQFPDYLTHVTESGCTVLDQEYLDIQVNGNDVRIGALYDYPFGMADNNAETASEEIQDFIKDFCDTENIKLFIAHRPDSFVFGNVSKVYDIDIVISSHLHGGQVVVPFKGGLYGGDQGWFPKYVHGMYEKDRIHLLITSGLGSSSQKLPRFLNPPEIMALELK